MLALLISMLQAAIYALVSVTIISLVSLVGIITLSIETSVLRKILIYVVSFAAGALFGDAFFHLLPEAISSAGGMTSTISISIIAGIALMFLIEKYVHWHHCHLPITENHVHPFSIMNLVGDSVHNFIDGLIIGISYLVSIKVGIATSIAIILHEIPQEMSDFGVLIHGGFTKAKALLANFATALTAVLGCIIALSLGSNSQSMISILIPFAAGGFIYIAGSDLIPELHKESNLGKSGIQFICFCLGVGVMILLLRFG
jgi:zinc and cadmium transporter